MRLRLVVFAALMVLGSPVIGQEATELSEGTVLRSLDKIGGVANDHVLLQGDTFKLGNLLVIVGECRYPLANPTGDAYTHLTVTNEAGSKDLFKGWMIASSPALNALDHARYDVWPLRCTTSDAVTE